MEKFLEKLVIFGGKPTFDEMLHVGRPNIGARDKLLEAKETFLGVGAKENAADVEKSLRDIDQAPAHALESVPEP